MYEHALYASGPGAWESASACLHLRGTGRGQGWGKGPWGGQQQAGARGDGGGARGERGRGEGKKLLLQLSCALWRKRQGKRKLGKEKNGGEGGKINKRRMSEGKIETKEETEKERERN